MGYQALQKLFLVLTLIAPLSGCSGFHEQTEGWGSRLLSAIGQAPEKIDENIKSVDQPGDDNAIMIMASDEPNGIVVTRQGPQTVGALQRATLSDLALISESTPSTEPTPLTSPKTAVAKKQTETLAKTQNETLGQDIGDYSLHLASHHEKASSEKEWLQLKRVFSSELASLAVRYPKVDLAGKGTFYRVMAGNFFSRTEASDICKRLKARYQYCAVMKGS